MKLSVLLITLICCGCNAFYDTDAVKLSPLDVGPETDTTDQPDMDQTDVGLNNNVPDQGESLVCSGPCVCPDDATCVCTEDCAVDCSGECEAQCFASTCQLNSGEESEFECAADAICNVECAGDCELTCTERSAECHTVCAEGTECIVRCGTARNSGPPPLRKPCDIECDGGPTDCGDGVFVCGRSCPD